MYIGALAASVMTLLACIAAGCSGGSYQPEVGPNRDADKRVGGFLQQFEGVWSGSSWETVIFIYDKKNLVAYLPDSATGSIVVFEPLGMVDPDKRAVSVTLIRQHAPKADCTAEYATKLVNQLPNDYVRKAAAFVSLNEDGLERWMSEQTNKFYELIPTSNPSGAAATGEPELRKAIQQLELYEHMCEITTGTTEVATLSNDSQAADTVKPLLIDDSGGNQYFKFIRKLSDNDRKMVGEKYAESAQNGPNADSTAAASIAEGKLADLSKLLNTITQKNADVNLWLQSYKETCLKSHPPGSGRTAEMLRGAGDIAGFDWRPAAGIVALCSGKRLGAADRPKLAY